jgi:DNA-directed RNA polymerase subunit RPC12/RpoP
MGISATCTHCGREFSFFQLYTAAPADADRCPHCQHRLGIANIAPLARRADAALEGLARYLRMVSEHQPAFRIQAASVMGPLAEALSASTGGPIPAPARVLTPA